MNLPNLNLVLLSAFEEAGALPSDIQGMTSLSMAGYFIWCMKVMDIISIHPFSLAQYHTQGHKEPEAQARGHPEWGINPSQGTNQPTMHVFDRRRQSGAQEQHANSTLYESDLLLFTRSLLFASLLSGLSACSFNKTCVCMVTRCDLTIQMVTWTHVHVTEMQSWRHDILLWFLSFLCYEF